MKNKLLISIIILFLVTPVLAQNSFISCVDNTTAQKNITLNVNISGKTIITTTAETITCPYGCDNTTGGINECNPDPIEQVQFMIVPIFVLSILSLLFAYLGVKLSEAHGVVSIFLMFISLTFQIILVNSVVLLSNLISLPELASMYNMAWLTLIATLITLFWYFFIILLKKALTMIKLNKEKEQDDFKL